MIEFAHFNIVPNVDDNIKNYDDNENNNINNGSFKNDNYIFGS